MENKYSKFEVGDFVYVRNKKIVVKNIDRQIGVVEVQYEKDVK